MKNIVDSITASPKAIKKPTPKFKLVTPSPALGGGSATTEVIRD